MSRSSPNEKAVYAIVVGRLIANLRERQGLTQADLAARAGLTQSNLSRIERGGSMPDAYVLRRLAEGLGLTLEELTTQVDAAFFKTRDAAEAALPTGEDPWWMVALKVVGIVGMTGLVMFAVAAVLEEMEDGDTSSPSGSSGNRDQA